MLTYADDASPIRVLHQHLCALSVLASVTKSRAPFSVEKRGGKRESEKGRSEREEKEREGGRGRNEDK